MIEIGPNLANSLYHLSIAFGCIGVIWGLAWGSRGK